MPWQSLSEQLPISLVAIVLAMPFVGALVRRGLWLDSKLASSFQEIPLNVMLTIIIVVLGLSAIIITPILSLFALGIMAFLLPINIRELTKFVMIGGLSIVLGALTAVDLPLSPITFMRVEGAGALYPMTFSEMLGLYSILGIAAIGVVSLFFLKADKKSGGSQI
jgi:predicted cation transporter